MNRTFYINEDLDPRDLAINLRFKGKPILHPRVRAAQEQLVALIKQAIQLEATYEPCQDCRVIITFGFPTRRNDIDGPLKRTIDAIQMAHKAMGYDWNDNRITRLEVNKTSGFPGIMLMMAERDSP